MDPLAWKGLPISGTLSISGPRAQLASASLGLQVQCCCPETWLQVGMSPRAQGQGVSGPDVSQRTESSALDDQGHAGPADLAPCGYRGAREVEPSTGMVLLLQTQSTRGNSHRSVLRAPGDSPLGDALDSKGYKTDPRSSSGSQHSLWLKQLLLPGLCSLGLVGGRKPS